MNASLPLCMAQALAPFAPPKSEVHRILAASERDLIAADLANNAAKATFHQRNDAAAMAFQIQAQDKTGAA